MLGLPLKGINNLSDKIGIKMNINIGNLSDKRACEEITNDDFEFDAAVQL